MSQTPLPPGRVPPSNLDAERSVLGGVLLDNSSMHDLIGALAPEDFYREAHGKIFAAMCSLYNDGEPVDRVTLKARLREEGALDAVGGELFVDLLDTVVPSASNLLYYGTIVHEKALSRRLIEAGHAIAAAGYEQAGTTGDLLDDAERRIFAVTEGRAAGGFADVREITKGTFKELEKRFERGERITGVPSGFASIDAMTCGWQPGDLVVIAGRPSHGKTALALNMVANAGVRGKWRDKRIGAGVFSLEMQKSQLVERLLSFEGRVDGQRIRTGQMIESDWAKLAKAASELADAGIAIDDSEGLSALEIRARSRRLAAKWADTEHPLGLIVIDYLQLMRVDGDTREQAIAEASRSLKGLAKELGLPVVLLAQLNRANEKRPDKRPMSSDLRESGGVEQDADVILFVHREEMYDKENEELRGKAEAIIAKQRNGPIGTVYLNYLHEFTLFADQGPRGYTESREAA